MIGDGTSLHDELIDTDQTTSVTTRYVWNVFSGSSLHEEGSLEGLFMEIVFLSWNVVRSHNSDLLTSSNGTRENSTESYESTFISGRNHFRDVHHKGTFGIASLHGQSARIILRTFVKISSSVLLSSSRRG